MPIESEAPSSSEVKIRPPEAAAMSGEDVQHGRDAPHRDAERAGGGLVGAHGHHVPTDRHLVPDEGADQEDRDEDDRRHGYAEDLPVAQHCERPAEAELRHVVRDRLGDAACAGVAAERDDDRREVEVGDQDAVHQAPAGACGEGDDDSRRDPQVIHLDHLAEDGDREHRHRADREIDEPREHEHRARDRDEADNRDLEKDDEQVRAGEEVGAGHGEDKALRDQRDEKAAALVGGKPAGRCPRAARSRAVGRRPTPHRDCTSHSVDPIRSPGLNS